MRCLTNRVMTRFLGGHSNAAEEAQIGEHLEQCQACRRLAERLSDDRGLRSLHQTTRQHAGEVVWAKLGGDDAMFSLPTVANLDIALQSLQGPDGLRTAASLPTGAEIHDSYGDGPQAEANLSHLGRFEILKRLGAGGFGIVYLAYDPILKRNLALKLPRHPVMMDAILKRRFLHEGQAAANMHHPNIVAVLEAGEVDGVCYLASVYSPGPTLADWLQRQTSQVSPTVAAKILAALAGAVSHAHESGILHRDIKPGNILLDESRPAGGLPFTPSLTDFGLAKSLGDGAHTVNGALLGTPRYMAPEQAAGLVDQIGAATDVYALGVVLYELLAGQPPIKGADNADTLRRVLEEDPLPLRRLAPQVSRDLAAICGKCLQKEPQRRYESAAALQQDLDRFLCGKKTLAQPDSPPRAAARWMQRHPARAGLIGSLVALLLLTVGGLLAYSLSLRELNSRVTTALLESRQAHARARASEQNAQQLLYASDMRTAFRAWREGDLRMLSLCIGQHVPQGRQTDLRGFEWRWLHQRAGGTPATLGTFDAALYSVTFSADGKWLAAAGQDGLLRVYQAATKQLQVEWPGGQGEINSAAFSSDGSLLATAGDDGTIGVWDWRSKTRLQRIQAFSRLAYGLQFAHQDQLLVSCGYDPIVKVWDVATGQLRHRLAGHQREVEALAVAPDGSRLATVSSDETVKLWRLSDWQLERTLRGHAGRVVCCAFSHDGQRLATGSVSRSLIVWDVGTGRRLRSESLLDAVQCVAFTPDGQWLATGDRGGTIHVWPLTAGKKGEFANATRRQSHWTAHQGRIYSLACSPHSGQLTSAGDDGEVGLWTPPPPPRSKTLYEERIEIEAFTFLPDTDMLATASDQGLLLWNHATGSHERVNNQECEGARIAYDRTGNQFIVGETSGAVSVWHASDFRQLGRWTVRGNADVDALCLLPGRSRIALIDDTHDERVTISQLDGTLIEHIPAPPYVRCCDPFPDGRRLAFDSLNDVVVWDLQARRELFRLQGHRSTINDIRISPDGSTIATASEDRDVRLWDGHTGRLRFRCAGHLDAVNSVAFSSAGRTLASGDDGGLLKLWHVASGQELCDFAVHDAGVRQVAFSPDTRHLAYLLHDSRLVVCSLTGPP